MTAGDHFERVAVVYESLRTTDEAPVRAIGQLLPGRPVTGLDIGCGTGRYTRLLRALLPDGSLLVAADVSAAMLAQLRAASRGHAAGGGAAAGGRRTAAVADRQPGPGHRVQLRSPLRPGPLPGRRRPGAGSPAASCSSTPAPRSRTRGRSGAATSRVSPSTSSACTARPRSGPPSGGPRGSRSIAAQTFQHPRTSTAERLGAQAQGRHYSTFSFYTPQELRAATATFLARLPGPEVCWVDEHLLVIAGASRHSQAEPDGPASPANQAIKDQALQIRAGRAGEAPDRRPGGRAQITPLSAQPIAGDDPRHSAQSGGSVRVTPDED